MLRRKGRKAPEAAFNFPQLSLHFFLLVQAFHMVSLLFPHMTNRLHALKAAGTKPNHTGISQTSQSLLRCSLSMQLLFCVLPIYNEDAKIIKATILLLWISLLRVLYAENHDKCTLLLFTQMTFRAFSRWTVIIT